MKQDQAMSTLADKIEALPFSQLHGRYFEEPSRFISPNLSEYERDLIVSALRSTTVSDERWAVNVLLEQIAKKFDEWKTWDVWRSDAATLVRGFKHKLESDATTVSDEELKRLDDETLAPSIEVSQMDAVGRLGVAIKRIAILQDRLVKAEGECEELRRELFDLQEFANVVAEKYRRLLHETGPSIVAQKEAAEASLMQMREALEAFVHYESWMDRRADNEQVCTYKRHTFGDLRRARRALSPSGGMGD